ncbi:MAG: glycosyltransferase [Deltaproteobacteria bacterium]|nr:glycosyltransferase [Deltaproteobacteria bacterium]
MNILVATSCFPALDRGVFDGKFVFTEVLGYAENGANVRVITPHFPGAKRRERVHDRVEVFRFPYFVPVSLQALRAAGVPMYRQKSLLAVAQIPALCFHFVVNILKHARWADIIHAQWTVSALFSLPAKWIFRKKIVVTARGSDLRLLPEWLNRYVFAHVDSAIDCFGPFPWNEENKRQFPSRYIKLPLLVEDRPPGGIPEDMKRVLAGKPGAFIVLYAGRFDRLKLNLNRLPLYDLIHAGRLLKSGAGRFHVFYLGDGDPETKRSMARLIVRLGLEDTVTLLGPRVNVLDYIHFCDIGVGGIAFNGVSQDFTAAEKPQLLVKGPDNAGSPWRDRVNAVFIEPESRADLVKKLAWAMKHREEIRSIGKGAKADMKAHMVESGSGAGLYLADFRRLLKRRTSPFCSFPDGN